MKHEVKHEETQCNVSFLLYGGVYNSNFFKKYSPRLKSLFLFSRNYVTLQPFTAEYKSFIKYY